MLSYSPLPTRACATCHAYGRAMHACRCVYPPSPPPLPSHEHLPTPTTGTMCECGGWHQGGFGVHGVVGGTGKPLALAPSPSARGESVSGRPHESLREHPNPSPRAQLLRWHTQISMAHTRWGDLEGPKPTRMRAPPSWGTLHEPPRAQSDHELLQALWTYSATWSAHASPTLSLMLS